MSAPRITLLIDAAFDGAVPAGFGAHDEPVVPLVDESTEYAHAVRAIADQPAIRDLPDAVPLDLYAYELLERMKERLAANPAAVETWVLPLWPEAAYAAAACSVHAGRELFTLYPEPSRVGVVARGATATSAAARRVLGRRPFEGADYVQRLTVLARERDWTVVEGDAR